MAGDQPWKHGARAPPSSRPSDRGGPIGNRYRPIKGDIATVAEMYAEDAFLLPAGSPMVRGRSAIKSFWEKASEGIDNIQLTTVDVKPLGADAAREIGTFSLHTKGSQPQEMTGKYVVIWQKTGSEWKLATDTWNSDK